MIVLILHANKFLEPFVMFTVGEWKEHVLKRDSLVDDARKGFKMIVIILHANTFLEPFLMDVCSSEFSKRRHRYAQNTVSTNSVYSERIYLKNQFNTILIQWRINNIHGESCFNRMNPVRCD